jgi:hypothetical protein
VPAQHHPLPEKKASPVAIDPAQVNIRLRPAKKDRHGHEYALDPLTGSSRRSRGSHFFGRVKWAEEG